MVTTEHLLAFTAMTLVVVAIPGPSVLFTIGRALSAGRRTALLTVVGNAAGAYAQIVAIALGLGALVATSITAFTVVKLIGAAYLVYLGVQAIRHRKVRTDTLAIDAALTRAGKVLREGFVVGLTNPKMLVFMAAALPQFVDRGAGHVPAQMLTLGLLVPIITVSLDSVWAMVAGTAREWFARSPRRIEVFAGTGGVAMIGMAPASRSRDARTDPANGQCSPR